VGKLSTVEIFDLLFNSTMEKKEREVYLTTAETTEGVRRIMSSFGLYKAGQIHRCEHQTLWSSHLVLLMGRSGNAWPNETVWKCRSLRSGPIQDIYERFLSVETFNAMEALAWASSLSPRGP